MHKPFGVFWIKPVSGGRDGSLSAEKNKNRYLIPQQQLSSSNQFQIIWDN